MMAEEQARRAEAKAGVDHLIRQSELRREYIVFNAVLLSLLPLLYSVAIFIYGDRLWRVGAGKPTVYSTALELPNAPESWGVLFMVLAVGVLISLFTRHDRALALFSAVAALVTSSFMVAFLTDLHSYDAPQAVPGAITYGVLSLAFFNLARLAWVSARNKVRL